MARREILYGSKDLQVFEPFRENRRFTLEQMFQGVTGRHHLITGGADDMLAENRRAGLAERAGLDLLGEIANHVAVHIEFDMDGAAAQLGDPVRGCLRIGQMPDMLKLGGAAQNFAGIEFVDHGYQMGVTREYRKVYFFLPQKWVLSHFGRGLCSGSSFGTGGTNTEDACGLAANFASARSFSASPNVAKPVRIKSR